MGRIVNYSSLSSIAKSNVQKAYAEKGQTISSTGEVSKKSSGGSSSNNLVVTTATKTPGVSEAIVSYVKQREATVTVSEKAYPKYQSAMEEERIRTPQQSTPTQPTQPASTLGSNTYTKATSSPSLVERARYNLFTGNTGRTKLDELGISFAAAVGSTAYGFVSPILHPIKTAKGLWGFGKEAVLTKGESVMEAGAEWGTKVRENPEIGVAQVATIYGGSKLLSLGISKLRTPKVLGSKEIASVGRVTEAPTTKLFIKTERTAAGITKYKFVETPTAVTPAKIAGKGGVSVFTKKPFGKVKTIQYGVEVKGKEIFAGTKAVDVYNVKLKTPKSTVQIKQVGKTTFLDESFTKASKVYKVGKGSYDKIFDTTSFGKIKGDVVSQISGITSKGKRYVLAGQKSYKVLEVGSKEGYVQKGISATKVGFQKALPIKKGFLTLSKSEKQIFAGGIELDLATETLGIPKRNLVGPQLGLIAERYTKASIVGPKTNIVIAGLPGYNKPSYTKSNYKPILEPIDIRKPLTGKSVFPTIKIESKVRTLTLPKKINVNAVTPGQKQTPRMIQEQKPIQMQKPLLIQKALTTFPTPRIPHMFPPPIFTIPPFFVKPPKALGGFGKRSISYPTLKKLKSIYKPSVVGGYYKYKTPVLKKKYKKYGFLSGFEIRGL